MNSINKSEWYLLEIIRNVDVNLQKTLDEIDAEYRLVAGDIAVFESSNGLNQDKLNELNIKIVRNLRKENIISNDNEDLDDVFSIADSSKKEVIFTFYINDESLEDEQLIDFLQIIGFVYEYAPEHEHFYNLEYKSDFRTPLIHNIRTQNLAIFLSQRKFGLSFIGYMKRDNRMFIRIKAFDYDEILALIKEFENTFKEKIIHVDNLAWEYLYSRKFSNGYRITDSLVLENDLTKQFLKTTKNSEFADDFSYTLNLLLKRGYLNEIEYSEISNKKIIAKFLHPYVRIQKEKLADFIWFSNITGKFYNEANYTDPKRIQPYEGERIYSLTDDLLYYIRSHWHQKFVEAAVEKVQFIWEQEDSPLIMLNFNTDEQFDFLSNSVIRATKDIDCLIRVKNKESNNEFIIPIESKRNSNEFKNFEKEIIDKIERRYSSIFSGFIMVAYFNKENSEVNELDINWSVGETTKAYLCVNHNFNKLVMSIKDSIERICRE